MIAFEHIHSEEQIANILAKALGRPQDIYIFDKLGTCEYIVPNLRGNVGLDKYLFHYYLYFGDICVIIKKFLMPIYILYIGIL